MDDNPIWQRIMAMLAPQQPAPPDISFDSAIAKYRTAEERRLDRMVADRNERLLRQARLAQDKASRIPAASLPSSTTEYNQIDGRMPAPQPTTGTTRVPPWIGVRG